MKLLGNPSEWGSRQTAHVPAQAGAQGSAQRSSPAATRLRLLAIRPVTKLHTVCDVGRLVSKLMMFGFLASLLSWSSTSISVSSSPSFSAAEEATAGDHADLRSLPKAQPPPRALGPRREMLSAVTSFPLLSLHYSKTKVCKHFHDFCFGILNLKFA